MVASALLLRQDDVLSLLILSRLGSCLLWTATGSTSLHFAILGLNQDAATGLQNLGFLQEAPGVCVWVQHAFTRRVAFQSHLPSILRTCGQSFDLGDCGLAAVSAAPGQLRVNH